MKKSILLFFVLILFLNEALIAQKKEIKDMSRMEILNLVKKDLQNKNGVFVLHTILR